MRCVDHLFEDLERLLEKHPVARLEQLETQLNQLERSIKMSQDALTNKVAEVVADEQALEAKVAGIGQSVTTEIQRVEAVIAQLKSQPNPDQTQIDAAVAQLETVKTGLTNQVAALTASQTTLDAEQAPA